MNPRLQAIYERSPIFVQNLVVSLYGLRLRRERIDRDFEKRLAWLEAAERWPAESHSGSAMPRQPIFFGRTKPLLTLWNRIPDPPGWTPWPAGGAPLWFFSTDGRAMPAWNLFGNLMRPLTLTKEKRSAVRDRHGRSMGVMSPRDRVGLLEVSVFNEAARALVALASALKHAGRKPDWRAVEAIFANYRFPHRFYAEAIPRIIELERDAGARSSFYFLNGMLGRFGARSGPGEIAALNSDQVLLARPVRSLGDPSVRPIAKPSDPWNPGARYVMSRIPFDRDAILLS